MLKCSVTGIRWIESRARVPLIHNANAEGEKFLTIWVNQPRGFGSLLNRKWRIRLRSNGKSRKSHDRRKKRELPDKDRNLHYFPAWPRTETLPSFCAPALHACHSALSETDSRQADNSP